jgi:hypothetical protein
MPIKTTIAIALAALAAALAHPGLAQDAPRQGAAQQDAA